MLISDIFFRFADSSRTQASCMSVPSSSMCFGILWGFGNASSVEQAHILSVIVAVDR